MGSFIWKLMAKMQGSFKYFEHGQKRRNKCVNMVKSTERKNSEVRSWEGLDYLSIKSSK